MLNFAVIMVFNADDMGGTLSFEEALSSEILVLDGAMGTMLQRLCPDEKAFHKEGFTPEGQLMKGCNDVLSVTAPEVIERIHRSYIESGARIIETNTFNANAISLADYGMERHVAAINTAAAMVARKAADSSAKKVWVAGSIGPTNKSLSMAMSMEGDEPIDHRRLEEAYFEQICALLEGGVDILLFETIFDSLNAKAAISAMYRAMEATGKDVPRIFSVTLTESGRTLAGQSLEAFIATISHGRPVAVGLNCGFGAEEMARYIESMSGVPYGISVYPNAGLPNAMGEYDETPEAMAAHLRPLMSRGAINIAGGCCGTTPEHIAVIAREAARYAPRAIPQADIHSLQLAGLDMMPDTAEGGFIKVGERCNVAGSRKFLRLINEGNITEALEIARAQVAAGAQVIDVNMDDAMLDSEGCMRRFVKALCGDPETGRRPVMIDSSHWPTITAALECVQGKAVVNSISLKEGEISFLEKARYIASHGAAMVVMAFDEKGQADTLERRIEICSRAYRLLTQEAGVNPGDIIFDPNILTVATGMEQHRRYALDFLNATRWIKENLPGARVSGGVSNLSFAFRGNNMVREAMHALFLKHAVECGLDMAIVNPSTLTEVASIPESLSRAIDDVLLDSDAKATDRLVAIAENLRNEPAKSGQAPSPASDKADTPDMALAIMIRRGETNGLEKMLDEALMRHGSALAVIDGPLMQGMDMTGELFGQGKIFLPQVVKSAHAMKCAVAHLTPVIEREKAEGNRPAAGKMVLATVKGDVHDIGKNIVSVIMSCNGYEIIDLGVMVPAEEIVRQAMEKKADIVGLSGLITPSLEEMCAVARLMEHHGLKIPLMVGGATTSALHTAVKIAPCYSGPVIHTRDAAAMPPAVRRFTDPYKSADSIKELRREQEALRSKNSNDTHKRTLTPEEARKAAPKLPEEHHVPQRAGITDMAIDRCEAREWINWRSFFTAWGLDGSMAAIADAGGCDHCRAQWLAAVPEKSRLKAAEAMQLWKEANRILDSLCKPGSEPIKARIALLGACSEGDDIVIDNNGEEIRIPTLRRPDTDDSGHTLALSDFIAPSNSNNRYTDHIGLFAVTTGADMEQRAARRKELGDDYGSLLYRTLADRLVEAATELMHHKVRKTLWGYSPEESEEPRRLLRQDYRGIRPAIGYPSLPDQSLIFLTDRVLSYGDMGISVTENGAMWPSASTTGLMIAHSQSHYFVIGNLPEAQRREYAERRGWSEEELSKFMPKA